MGRSSRGPAERRGVAAWFVGAVVVGVALGYLGARVVFVNSGLSLIPWGLAALALGVLTRGRARALALAAVFGFSVSLAFMLFGYAGTQSTASRIVPFSLLGLLGAVCAVCLALAAHIIARLVAHRRSRRGRTTD